MKLSPLDQYTREQLDDLIATYSYNMAIQSGHESLYEYAKSIPYGDQHAAEIARMRRELVMRCKLICPQYVDYMIAVSIYLDLCQEQREINDQMNQLHLQEGPWETDHVLWNDLQRHNDWLAQKSLYWLYVSERLLEEVRATFPELVPFASQRA